MPTKKITETKKVDANKENKLKSLDVALSQIEKSFGKLDIIFFHLI